MSEIRPRSEVQGSGELRPRDRGTRRPQSIARHGRLKKASPIGTIFRFLAAALAVVLVAGVSLGAVAANALKTKLDDNAVDLVGADGEAIAAPPSIGAIEGGFNILIVGTDTREGQGGLGGEDEGAQLNDVNMLLHVSEDQSNAVAISFPRDMVVGIPECPYEDGSGTKYYSTEPINTALSYGGLNCVVMTVSELTGLDIQFAGMIGFRGVVNMADAIGGVEICTDGPIEDEYSGLSIPDAGTWTLNGEQALAFLRTRHGVGDGSDLTRISSQQVYLSSLVRKLKADGTLTNPATLYNLAQAAVNNMTLSSSLADVPTMVSIALALKDVPLERVTFVQYPGTTGSGGIYAGKVRPDTYSGDEMMALIAQDQPFQLAQAGDDSGSMAVEPPPPTKTPIDRTNPKPVETTAPVDNSALPTVSSSIKGQTAANYTCSVSNSY